MLNIDQIRKKMEDRNISKVARKIGVSKQFISQVLSGKDPASQNILDKLNKYLEEN